MTLRRRRYIYGAFILIFILAAPPLLLYTRGYRFNLKTSGLALTGTLVVSTVPSGATVMLNGIPLKYQTPQTVSAIPPAIYRIRLTKPGYRPWEKRLTVSPGGALFASNVRLWRDALPITLADGDYRQFVANADGSQVILVSSQGHREQFWRFTTADESLSLAGERSVIDQPTDELLWSPLDDQVLVRAGAKASVLDLTDRLPRFLDFSQSLSARHRWRWSQTEPSKLYASDGQTISTVNARTADVSPFATNPTGGGRSETIADFWVTRTTVDVVSTRARAPSILRVYPLAAGQPTAEFSLPTPKAYHYITSAGELVVLEDSDRIATLWHLTGTALLPVLTVPDMTTASFLSDTNELLYATPHEIWTYSAATDTRTLLTRLGTAIDNVGWYPSGNHVLFTADRSFYAIERDERDLRNRWELFSFGRLIGYDLHTAGSILYFAGSLGTKSALWRLDLQ